MGFFITVEGPNGVGKSTFIKRLEKMLSSENEILLTREPSNTKFGNYVKKNENMLEGETYAYLIAADRCYHLKNFIEPALDNGKTVISDRYIESSLVLQCYDGVDIKDIWRLNCSFLVPDLSVILLGKEEILERRLSKRRELTRFEKKMTRRDEIEGYIKAADFLERKGYNVVVFYNNTELELEHSLNSIKEIIINLRRRENNGQEED